MSISSARRDFLQRAGRIAAGGLLLGPAGCSAVLAKGGRFPAVTPDLLTEVWERHPVPEITPTDDFYVLANAIPPEVTPSEWSFELRGLVDRPLRLTYQELRARPARRLPVALECVGNPPGGQLMGNAWWTGPRLRDLLADAGVQDNAVEVVFRCLDGYHTSIPIAKAMDPSTLLAVAMNDEPLTKEHGRPARLLAPGLHGFKNPKYFHTIEVVGVPHVGYYEESGWTKTGEIDITSRVAFATAREGQVLPPASDGSVLLSGTALGGVHGVSRVIFRVTGNGWMDALLKPALGPYAWHLWAMPWIPPGPGEYAVTVRAWDAEGHEQPAARWDAFPNGATGLHTMRFRYEGKGRG